ncbi:MAG: HAD family hydrolase [Thiotrichales bacterium]|nr:HAD family hydrolase [Thiotrichales bacterium]
MKSWMHALADHYEATRNKYPDDKLVILFDIDGTILDTRYTVLKLLKSYDKEHDTTHFDHIHITDINFNEEDLRTELEVLAPGGDQLDQVYDWYTKHRWTSWAVFEGNKPFPGVLEVIRWFQLQPNTDVGLNTNRSESIREQTLNTMNRLGKEFRIHIKDELLVMNPDQECITSGEAKMNGVREITARGHRVFAMVDNEPENLERISGMADSDEILLLHANSFYSYDRSRLTDKVVKGKVYDLTELIPKRSIPEHIQFVWQSVNNEASLNKFLGSNVSWADLSDLIQPVIQQNNDIDQHRLKENGYTNLETLFDEYIKLMRHRNRGIRLCFDQEFSSIEFILDKLVQAGVDNSQLWFNAGLDQLSENGFRFLSDAFPGAIVECPIDFLGQVIMTTPGTAEHLLDMYSDWGINRFAMSWRTSNVKILSEIVEAWGFELTIYDIRNLETFLQAALLTPRAIVSNFNFPAWKSINEPAYEKTGSMPPVNRAKTIC